MTTEPKKIRISEDCELAVRIDDYSIPWDSRPPILMLHGLAESGEAFRQWVPHFVDRHVTVRPDLRGFGDSTAMPSNFAYRLDELGQDIIRLLDALGLERVFLIGFKIGGTLSLRLAARYPERVIATAAVAAPVSLKSFSDRAPGWREQIRDQGVEPWVRETTQWRLGTSLPPEAVEWWIRLMSRTPPSTLDAFLRMVPTVDISEEVPGIRSPTVVITTTGSGLASVESVRGWQETIPTSTLQVLSSDSYHVGATHPEACSRIVREFFDRLSG
jgi:3-oxoadipate enol-lactonase